MISSTDIRKFQESFERSLQFDYKEFDFSLLSAVDLLTDRPDEVDGSQCIFCTEDETVVVDGVSIRHPPGWSETAVKIFAQKYMRKADVAVPLHGVGSVLSCSAIGEILSQLYRSAGHKEKKNAYLTAGLPFRTSSREKDVTETIFRVALSWAFAWLVRDRERCNLGCLATAATSAAKMCLICVDLMRRQAFSPNSPQWFNAGIGLVYAVKSGDTVYDIDGMTADGFDSPQLHACFIHPVEDNLVGRGGIMEHLHREASIFKFGSGSGTNYSRLRHSGAPLSKGGKSSGVMSFLKVGDSSAGAIKSGGTTRRSARMLILDSDHPNIREFVNWKRIEEDKVAALVAGNEMLISSMNASRDGIAAQFSDRYAGDSEKVEKYTFAWEGGAYQTVSGQNGNNTVRIMDYNKDSNSGLIDEIAFNAWACGDPGVAFNETIQSWDTMPALNELGHRIEATNPCGEFIWRNNTACNLASINLHRVFHEGLHLSALVSLLVNVLDLSISIAGYPTPEIASMTKRTRPIGLGVSALAMATADLGMKYGSAEMLNVTEKIMARVWFSAFVASSRIREELGVDDGELTSSTSMTGWGRIFGRRMADYTISVREDDAFRRFIDDQIADCGPNPPNNGQLTAVAPTGTISLIMDCETTGIEPYYARSQSKTLAGGGMIESASLRAVGNCVEDGVISVDDHINVVSCVQRFTCGGVSKTINMPASATVQDVRDAIEKAYKKGLKSITVYRDGSKYSQPLEGAGRTSGAPAKTAAQTSRRRPLPFRRSGITTKAKIDGNSIFIRTGEYEDGTLGELFLDMHKSGATMRSVLHCFAVAVSIGLQYGVPVEEFIEAFVGTKFEPNGMVFGHDEIKIASSIMDLVFREVGLNYSDVKGLASVSDASTGCLRLHLEQLTGDVCSFCGGASIVQTGTCKMCRDCGESSGGCS